MVVGKPKKLNEISWELGRIILGETKMLSDYYTKERIVGAKAPALALASFFLLHGNAYVGFAGSKSASVKPTLSFKFRYVYASISFGVSPSLRAQSYDS